MISAQNESSKRTEIKFVKPCRPEWSNNFELSPAYCRSAVQNGMIVQINLDNCSLQRMEELDNSATIDDVKRVGLLPLVEILKEPVTITAIGVNEMPDKWVAGARTAFERFCSNFWPGHSHDVEATERSFDLLSTARNIQFRDLSEGRRAALGCSYVSLLQIQNIRASFPQLTPIKQFEAHLNGLIQLLDLVSAFELEIAKYAYWNIDHKEIAAALPKKVQQRLTDIKDNFSKQQNSLKKCRDFAFNGAMDLYWLSASSMTEDLGVYLDVGGKHLLIDAWVGTNDLKLYRISQDIHSVFSDDSSLKKLAVSRERELSDYQYWKNVDAYSEEILRYRSQLKNDESFSLLDKIDNSVNYLEDSLGRTYETLV